MKHIWLVYVMWEWVISYESFTTRGACKCAGFTGYCSTELRMSQDTHKVELYYVGMSPIVIHYMRRWLIHMCAMTHHMTRHHSSIFGHYMGMTPMWHDWSVCVPWLIIWRATTHPFMCHDSSTYVLWPIHKTLCYVGQTSALTCAVYSE